MWSKFKTLDLWLYLLPLVLGLASITGIYSITFTTQGTDLALKQGIFLLLGLMVLIIMTFIDYRAIEGFSTWLYLLSLASLIILALLPASSSLALEEFGARRWYRILSFQFQPSEIMKITTIILLSSFLSKFNNAITNKVLAFAGIIVLIPVAIVLQQPDLGTAIILLLSSSVLIFCSGLSRKQMIAIIFLILIAWAIIILAYKQITPFEFILKDYQRERIEIFLDPDKDPSQKGYNILQSVIAVGSGGVIGKGLGFGSQSQLHFLPVAHSDFIFATLAESWGFLGATGIIVVYTILLSRIIMAVGIAKDRFGILLSAGFCSMLLFEVLINIGMNIRLFPVTGIPLPLLSYGGTSILSTCFILGLIQSIIMRYKKINF